MKCACFMFGKIYFCHVPPTKASAWRNGMAPVMMAPVLSGRENWDRICIGMAWYWRSHSYPVQNTEYKVTPRKGYPGFWRHQTQDWILSLTMTAAGREMNRRCCYSFPSVYDVSKYTPYRVCISYTHDSKFCFRLPFLVPRWLSPTCLDNSTSLVFEMSISACPEGLSYLCTPYRVKIR